MKRNLPYILMIALGLIIAVGSYVYLSMNMNEKEVNTLQVVVPTAEIPVYKTIAPSDLTFKEITEHDYVEGMVTDPQKIIGKITNTILYPDWAISEQSIIDNAGFKNKHVVAINVNYVRSSGAKPGDRVDVYCVRIEKGLWTLAEQSVLAAKEALVVAIEDIGAKDTSLDGRGNTAIAVLALDPKYTPLVVPGALEENTNYVLAVRHDIEKSVTPVLIPEKPSELEEELEEEQVGINE